jgi:hypothetical protein
MGTTKRALRAKRPKRVDRRKTTSTRITPELRVKIDGAAEQSERSLAQEIEFRLEQSFAEEKSQAVISDEELRGLYAQFGKLETFMVARLLANAIHTIEVVTGKNWMDDPEAHRQTQEACKTILDSFRPPDGKGPIGVDVAFEGIVGKDAAKQAIISEFGSNFEKMRGPAKFFRTKKKAE